MRAELIWALGVFAAVIVTAIAVNRLAPAYRPRLRGVVILFALYAIALGLAIALGETDQPLWTNRLEIAADVLRALTIVNLGGLLAFGLLTRVSGMKLPMIASDLVVGLAYIVATLGVLSAHDIDLTGALATGAVVSAVLAISLQTTLGNILGGVALQLDGSIHEGDWIQLENGKQGKVRAIRWRHTLVETRDWTTIVVPNAQLLGNNITILGWRDTQHVPSRYWVWFNVDFRHSPTRVIQVVTDALHASPIENVAADPKPSVVCMDFAKDGRDSVAVYAVRYWLTDLAVDDPTSSRVRARIYAALQRAGIPLAIPAQTNLVEVHDQARDADHHERKVAEHLDALDHVPLFHVLDKAELRTLAEGMSHVLYTAGEMITRQGAIAHWLYVMTSGKAEVRTHADGDAAPSHTVATLEAPNFFGEMGLMTGAPRSADVIALTDVECFRLGKATFERVLAARPDIAENLADTLALRHVGLIAVRDALDEEARIARTAHERDKILGGIKRFFGL
jgi:small-conductance mechanosensitive channel/CRP-like cAMP-binding protein